MVKFSSSKGAELPGKKLNQNFLLPVICKSTQLQSFMNFCWAVSEEELCWQKKDWRTNWTTDGMVRNIIRYATHCMGYLTKTNIQWQKPKTQWRKLTHNDKKKQLAMTKTKHTVTKKPTHNDQKTEHTMPIKQNDNKTHNDKKTNDKNITKQYTMTKKPNNTQWQKPITQWQKPNTQR